MKKTLLYFLLFFNLSQNKNIYSQAIPVPDHVVLVMMENNWYSQIIGSAHAPYINSFVGNPHTAIFTKSYALTHPSQPNYLLLYSGSTQGVNTDDTPGNTPFSTCNLGASLLNSGHTFKTYSEDLPAVGYLGSTSGNYVRSHNPACNWQGTLNNGLPDSCNQPFTNLPADYSKLPTVSFFIPNLIDDMHDTSGTAPSVSDGDTWLRNNLDAYIQWTMSHNSLMILTFDEDDLAHNNHITTLFIGPMIKGGQYNDSITHLNVLRTLEEMYGLPYCSSSDSVSAINNCWKLNGIQNVKNPEKGIQVWPNPACTNLFIQIDNPLHEKIFVDLNDLRGRTLKKMECKIDAQNNILSFQTEDILSGIYFLKIYNDGMNVHRTINIEH